MVFDQGQFGQKSLRPGHNVFNGLQFGHVKTRFRRHGQVKVARAQTCTFVARNRATHIAFAPVVSGQRQMPVAKHAVQLLQVVQRSPGRRQHIAPVIAKSVLFEFEISACSRHELPHAGGLGAGDGLRVERAFDKGQQCQFGGHVALFKLFNNMKQVFL